MTNNANATEAVVGPNFGVYPPR